MWCTPAAPRGRWRIFEYICAAKKTDLNHMNLRIIVLAKQVPDTRNVGKDAMTPEGTVNRAALPAIFNPDDMNALEQALRLKEQNPEQPSEYSPWVPRGRPN